MFRRKEGKLSQFQRGAALMETALVVALISIASIGLPLAKAFGLREF